MTQQTYVTEEGYVDVLTLPYPWDDAVWRVCAQRCRGRLTPGGSYELDMDQLADILILLGLPGVLTATH